MDFSQFFIHLPHITFHRTFVFVIFVLIRTDDTHFIDNFDSIVLKVVKSTNTRNNSSGRKMVTDRLELMTRPQFEFCSLPDASFFGRSDIIRLLIQRKRKLWEI